MIEDARDYPAPREAPGEYPGKRPSGPYLLDGSKIYLITFKDPGDVYSAQIRVDGSFVNLNDRLKQLGVSTLAARTAVLAYGSNANPGQLLYKWEQGRGEARKGKDAKRKHWSGVADIVVVLKGTLSDVDVVVEQFTSYGAPYAGILENERTKDKTTECWLTLLDATQLQIMNWTEGIRKEPTPDDKEPTPDYKVAEFHGYRIDGFQWLFPRLATQATRMSSNRRRMDPQSPIRASPQQAAEACHGTTPRAP